MSDNFLYLKVAKDIEKQISSGKLTVGEKLPSVRTQAQSLGTSVNTIIMAYNHLMDRGVIYSKEKYGFFVSQDPQVKRPQFSPGLQKISELKVVDEVQWTLDSLATPGIINLSGAIPDPELLPTKSIARSVRKYSQRIDEYAHPQGMMELRSALAKRISQIAPRTKIGAEHILVTNGALEAIYIALKTLLKPGDVIAIENPTYYMYFKVIQSLNLKVVQISSHPETGLCPQALSDALLREPIKLILCQPNFANPTGALMPQKHRSEIARLCHHHNVILVQDDINGELAYDGRKHPALLNEDYDIDAIYISSFSKTFSPGVRLGHLASFNHSELFKQTKSMLTVGAEVPFQLAMADYLTHGNPERWLKKVRPVLAARFHDYKQFMASFFPRHTAHTCPQGGFVTWVELPRECDSRQIFKSALEQNLSVSPGTIFSADQSFQNFIRLNYAFALKGKHLHAMKLLAEILKKATH